MSADVLSSSQLGDLFPQKKTDSLSDLRREEYINKMKRNGEWADDLVIYATSILLSEHGFDLEIYKKNNQKISYSNNHNEKVRVYHESGHYKSGKYGSNDVPGDGNCFFHSILCEIKKLYNKQGPDIYMPNGSKVDHKFLRKEACKVLQDPLKVPDDLVDAMYIAEVKSSASKSSKPSNKINGSCISKQKHENSNYQAAIIFAQEGRDNIAIDQILKEQQQIWDSFHPKS